jgi:hypothetical protein
MNNWLGQHSRECDSLLFSKDPTTHTAALTGKCYALKYLGKSFTSSFLNDAGKYRTYKIS